MKTNFGGDLCWSVHCISMLLSRCMAVPPGLLLAFARCPFSGIFALSKAPPMSKNSLVLTMVQIKGAYWYALAETGLSKQASQYFGVNQVMLYYSFLDIERSDLAVTYQKLRQSRQREKQSKGQSTLLLLMWEVTSEATHKSSIVFISAIPFNSLGY